MAKIYAYEHSGIESLFVGMAFVNDRHGIISSTFAYDLNYLNNPTSHELEPSLPLQSGNWQVAASDLPNSFLDSAPDRWGRNLIQKKYPGKHLTNLDYMLEVSDMTRQGSLRFKTEMNGDFLSAESKVPKIIALSQLLEASKTIGYKKEDEAVKFLLSAGTASLGGARPKAIVQDGGELWIAKFEQNSDTYDIVDAEYEALKKASASGIKVPEFRLKRVGNSSILLLKRFDRELKGEVYGRIGYISALTALGAKDGERKDYVDIIKFIRRFSPHPNDDVEELLRRIRLNLEINNTDDHLRNHGFLWQKNGWALSPAFDLVPNPNRSERRATAINGTTDFEHGMEELEKLEKMFKEKKL